MGNEKINKENEKTKQYKIEPTKKGKKSKGKN